MSFLKDIDDALKNGVTTFQLRLKDTPTKEFISLAKDVKKLCKKRGVAFVINDRLDVALLVKADGLHLGQDDCDIKSAKKLFKGFIGVTCRSLKEAKKAQKDGASYIGVGAVFPTKSKKDTIVLGLKKLKKINDSVKIPVVAIGGIDIDNIKDVLKVGVDGVAVISAILNSNSIKKSTKELKKAVSSY